MVQATRIALHVLARPKTEGWSAAAIVASVDEAAMKIARVDADAEHVPISLVEV